MEDSEKAKATVEAKYAIFRSKEVGGKGSRESNRFKLTKINGEWKIAKP